MYLGRCTVLLRLVLFQHLTWAALVSGFRLSRPGFTHERIIRGGLGRQASGYYTERRKGVVVRMPAEQPHHRSFVEGIEQEDYNTTSEEKRNEQEIGDPIDNEIDDVTKYLRKKNPELFSFDKKYQGPTQIRRNPSSIYYYPLDHPDISVQFHPSYGDPGYGEGEYNDAFGVTGEKKNCKANATLLHAQVPGGVLPPNNSNTKSSSFSTQNRYSAIEGEGRSSDSMKDDAGNLTIGGAVDVVEASTFTKEQKTLTYNTGKYESQLFLSVIKGNETVEAAPTFDTIRSSCYRNAVPRSRNVAAKDKLMNLSIPVAEPSVEVGAVDALLEKQMKNSQNTKENIVAVIQNNQTRISTLKIGCSLNRLPVTASENNRGDVEEKSVTTAVRMDPKDGGANVSGFPLLTRVIENDFSFSNSGCTPILEATANESSSDSSYDMEHSSISDEFGERQVIRSSLQDNQQISSTSPSQSAHAEMETAANVDDNAIADTIDTTTKNIIKELLAEDNTTAFSPAPLFPPPKNVMDVTYVSSASNIGTGYPIEMAGVWLIDSLLLIRENGSATGLAKTSLTERNPQDSLVLRIDGQVFGGPVIEPQAVVRWSDPNGCRCCGGRWVVYKNDETGVTKLRIILFGNKERTNGLALDGTVLIMREWDQLESKHIDVPHVIGYVSEVQERESALVDHGRGTAQRKLGECTIRKISKTGLNQLSLTVPEPKSIIT